MKTDRQPSREENYPSGLELRLPTEAELRTTYAEDFETAFPPDELKPLSSILRPWREGTYQPWCLYDGGSGPIGECFLALGSPGCALLDYLCVTEGWRNDGFGSWMLKAMLDLSDWTCILGECEAPEYARDRDLAARRLHFYLRSGARLAGYDTELFGVRYRTLYWADHAIDDETLAAEHRKIYRLDQMPDWKRKLFQIPCPEDPAVTAANAETTRELLARKQGAEWEPEAREPEKRESSEHKPEKHGPGEPTEHTPEEEREGDNP